MTEIVPTLNDRQVRPTAPRPGPLGRLVGRLTPGGDGHPVYVDERSRPRTPTPAYVPSCRS